MVVLLVVLLLDMNVALPLVQPLLHVQLVLVLALLVAQPVGFLQVLLPHRRLRGIRQLRWFVLALQRLALQRLCIFFVLR